MLQQLANYFKNSLRLLYGLRYGHQMMGRWQYKGFNTVWLMGTGDIFQQQAKRFAKIKQVKKNKRQGQQIQDFRNRWEVFRLQTNCFFVLFFFCRFAKLAIKHVEQAMTHGRCQSSSAGQSNTLRFMVAGDLLSQFMVAGDLLSRFMVAGDLISHATYSIGK